MHLVSWIGWVVGKGRRKEVIKSTKENNGPPHCRVMPITLHKSITVLLCNCATLCIYEFILKEKSWANGGPVPYYNS